MHKEICSSRSSMSTCSELDILRRIEYKLCQREEKKEKKQNLPKEPEFKKWLASKTLSVYLAETLMTEFPFENDLLRVIDTIKTVVQVISCSMRKQGFAHMFLLGSNKNAKWYGSIIENGISWTRFFIDELTKTGAVCMIAYRGCPKIKRIRGQEHSPFIVVLNVPSHSTIDHSLYGCSWIIYRQPETAALTLLERDALIEGKKAISAGYAVFGVSTILVLSLEKREEVMEFVYDVNTGDFLEVGELTLENKGHDIVFNESHFDYYDENIQNWIRRKTKTSNVAKGQEEYHPFFSGNVVVDANRVLQSGGLYLSPRDIDCKDGRLRLLFDCIPLAFIMSKLGGIASDGEEPLVSRKPHRLGEKTAFFFGAKDDFQELLEMIKYDTSDFI